MPERSLADILASPDVGLPESVHPLCLAGKLRAEMDRLQQAVLRAETEADLAVEEARARAEGEGKPRRMGDVSEARAKREEADALSAEYEAVLERREAATVHVRFRAWSPGRWREWKAANPPREGSDDDVSEARGHCSLDALCDGLLGFVADVSGEPVSDAQWSQIVATVSHRDLVDAAKVVLGLHEAQVRDQGKGALRHWLATHRSGTV